MSRSAPGASRARRLGARAVLALCALGALAVSGPAPAAAGTPPKLPAQGIYDSCSPALSPDRCAARLQRLGQAGFEVVVNGYVFHRSTLDESLAYADAAAAAGMRVIWPLHTTEALADPAKALDLAALVSRLRAVPNTWGYYLYDEPKQRHAAEVAARVERIKALDPDHPRLVMGCGICWGGDPTGANISFLAPLDVALGTDAYPVREGDPDAGAAYRGVEQNAGSLARVARPGQPRVVTLQAWRWGDSPIDVEMAGLDGPRTRFPTRDEIQAQRDAAVAAARPDLILWYTATQVIGWEDGQRPDHWAQPADADQRWANLLGGAFAPLPNDAPVARLALRTRGRAVVGRRLVADARASRDPDGRIVRYRWRLNGRRLPCGRARCAFRARRAGVQRLRVDVVDDRRASASTHRKLRIRPKKRAKRQLARVRHVGKVDG